MSLNGVEVVENKSADPPAPPLKVLWYYIYNFRDFSPIFTSRAGVTHDNSKLEL